MLALAGRAARKFADWVEGATPSQPHHHIVIPCDEAPDRVWAARSMRAMLDDALLPFSASVSDASSCDGWCLMVDDDQIHSPMAALRFVGRLTHTMPSANPLDAALVEDWLELHTRLTIPILCLRSPHAVGMPLMDPEVLRDWLLRIHLPSTLHSLETAFASGARWLGGFTEPTAADFCWAETLRWITSEPGAEYLGSFIDIPDPLREYVRLYESAIGRGRVDDRRPPPPPEGVDSPPRSSSESDASPPTCRRRDPPCAE